MGAADLEKAKIRNFANWMNKDKELILKGQASYVNMMLKHLKKEHPSVRGKISIR